VSPWILLQTRYQFLPAPDSRSVSHFGIIAAVVVLVLVVGGVLISRKRQYLDAEGRRRYSRALFVKMAKSLGLGQIHINYLEYLIRVCRVGQPLLLCTNPGRLDDGLRKGLYSLQQNAALKPEDRERRMSHLFQIKQIIERSAKRGIGIKSTHFLRVGQALTLEVEGAGKFPSRVLSNMQELLAVSAPTTKEGSPRRWARGSRVRLSFWREGDAGYSFETKITAYDTIKGVPCILIQHARSLKRAQQRRFRRTPPNRPCFFYPVHIVEQPSGRGTERRAMVQTNRRLLGHVLDISAGGCSVATLTPLAAGDLCRMEFEIRRQSRIVVFGKVKRLRGQTAQRGGVMHVMFTTLSAQHMNQIYSFVYDYSAPGSLRPAVGREGL